MRRLGWWGAVLASVVALVAVLLVVRDPGGTPEEPESEAVPMAPPVDARLLTDCGAPGAWESENGGFLGELAERGPDGRPVLRSTLLDGQTVPGTGAVERNDLRGDDVPLGSVRWMVWRERFVEMPKTDLDRWQIIGPAEIHGITVPQATVMPEVSADGRRRLNANAGRPEVRYIDLGPVVPGEWSQYMVGLRYSEGDDGWIEVWRDGRLAGRVEGPTTTEDLPGYWKFGHYRNADIDGTSVYDVSGCSIYAG